MRKENHFDFVDICGRLQELQKLINNSRGKKQKNLKC